MIPGERVHIEQVEVRIMIKVLLLGASWHIVVSSVVLLIRIDGRVPRKCWVVQFLLTSRVSIVEFPGCFVRWVRN